MSKWPEFNANPELNYSNNPSLNHPLHFAAQNRSVETMKLLLERGAKINGRNGAQSTPLHIVVERSLTCRLETREKEKTIECLNLLLDHHADPNLHDRNGLTPLHMAAMQSEEAISTILIQNGANIYSKSRSEGSFHQGTSWEGWSQSIDGYNDSSLKLLIKHCPKSVIKALDQCIELKPDFSKHHYKNWTINLDFLTMGEFRPGKSVYESPGEMSSNSNFIKEVLRVRNEDVNEKSRTKTEVSNSIRKIIQHPVAQVFLHKKWKCVKWYYYLLVMMMHFLYSVTYTSYTLINFRLLCEPKDHFDMVKIFMI